MRIKTLIFSSIYLIAFFLFSSLIIAQDYQYSDEAFKREIEKYVEQKLEKFGKQTIPREKFLITQIRLLNEEIKSRVSNVSEIKDRYFDNLEARLAEVKQIKNRLKNTNSPGLISYISELENKIEETIDQGRIDYQRQKVFEDGIQLLYIAEEMANLDPSARVEENPRIKKRLQDSKSKFISAFGEAPFKQTSGSSSQQSESYTVFDIFKEWRKTNDVKYEVRWTDVQIMKNNLLKSGTAAEKDRMLKRELRWASQMFNYNDFDLADRVFEEILNRYKYLNQVDDIYFYRAEANYQLGRFHKAKGLYEELFEKYPTSTFASKALRRLIFIAHHFNDFEQMTGYYDKYTRVALSSEEGYDEVNLLVGSTAFNNGSYEGAVMLLEKIPVSSEYYRESRYLLGKAYAGAQNFEQAEILYNTILDQTSLEPGTKFSVLVKLGYIAYEKKEYNQVLNYLDQINPGWVSYDNVLHLYGWTFYRGVLEQPIPNDEKDFTDAKKYLKELISRYPESDYYLESKSLLGFIYQVEQKPRLAINEYDYVYRSKFTKDYSDKLNAERKELKERMVLTDKLADKALEENNKTAFYKAKRINAGLTDRYLKLSYADVSSASMSMRTEIRKVTQQISELDRLYAIAEERGETQLMSKIKLLRKRLIRVLRDYPQERYASSELGLNYFDEHPASRKVSVIEDKNNSVVEMREGARSGRENILRKLEELEVEIARARNRKDYKKLVQFEIQKDKFDELLKKFDYIDTYANSLDLQDSRVNLEKWSDYGAFGIANVNFSIKKSKGEQIANYQQQIQKINQILNSRKALLEHKVNLITGEIDLMTRKVREQERRREREELDRRFRESYFDTHESEVQNPNLLPPDVE